MDRSLATSCYRSPLRPSIAAPDCALGIYGHAHHPYHDRNPHAGRGDLATSAQGSLRRQHAALANLVRAVEPDFADALARDLLDKFGSLTAILALPEKVIANTTGSAVLAGILSSTKRLVIESLLAGLPRTPFSPANQEMVRYLTATLGSLKHEEAHVFFLDVGLRLLSHEIFAYGTANRASFPVQNIFRRAVSVGSTRLVLIHNHPSGIPEPSESDKISTREICRAGKAVGIIIHDHLVVAGPHVFSFRASGFPL
jgi:DNA repair protein RadC